MRKGLSISTEVLVALAIAVIVLLALVSMLMGIVPGASSSLGCDADFRIQCNRFITAGGCKEGSSLNILDDSYVGTETAECAVGSDVESTVEAACCGGAAATTTTLAGP